MKTSIDSSHQKVRTTQHWSIPLLISYRIFFVIKMYNSEIYINAYLDSMLVFITDPIHNHQMCTTGFISLSYSYLDGTSTYYIFIIFKSSLDMDHPFRLGFRSNDVMINF